MTLDQRLKEIKSRCDAATEGPWFGTMQDVIQPGNSKFIAHARTDVPMLLEMVEYLLVNISSDLYEYEKNELKQIAEKYK